jgi:peptidoglycan hydrolase-like protein with peptidoglycan-binding domain
MKILVLSLLIAGFAVPVFADEQLRAVQQELKSQGFYYSEVDGQAGAETTAAIRRYQIRNGLEVTGNLTQETLSSLKIGNARAIAREPSKSRPQSPEIAPAPRSAPAPPVDTEESDRGYLRQPVPPSIAQSPQNAPLQPPSRPSGVGNFGQMFAHTPYQSAPFEVQQETLRRAQDSLSRLGYYRGPIDGIPGFATERALDFFQSERDLAMTGRLDLDTLAEMRLLPTRRFNTRIERPSRYYGETYRGIWVR